MLEFIILANLMLEPCHGYEIKKLLGGMKINNNTLYPLLKKIQLEDFVSMELMQQENKPAKKVYSITEKGKQRLFSIINDFDVYKASSNDEFYLRVAFFQFLGKDTIKKILDAREKALSNIGNKERVMELIEKFPDNENDLKDLHHFVSSQYESEKKLVESLKQKYGIK